MFYIEPFVTMKISPVMKQKCQIINKTLKKFQRLVKTLTKRQNFAKSGHTACRLHKQSRLTKLSFVEMSLDNKINKNVSQSSTVKEGFEEQLQDSVT